MKVHKWKYTLSHEKVINSWWILVDSLVLLETLDNWDVFSRFIVPPMKVKNYTKDSNVLDWTNWYTENDLEDILNEEINSLQNSD